MTKCLHCRKRERHGAGVWCRRCTESGRTRSRFLLQTKPWWEWDSYVSAIGSDALLDEYMDAVGEALLSDPEVQTYPSSGLTFLNLPGVAWSRRPDSPASGL